MKVVFTVLDALPLRHVGPSHTPNLPRSRRSAGVLRTGPAQMTSATYPNHATFVTGTDARGTGS